MQNGFDSKRDGKSQLSFFKQLRGLFSASTETSPAQPVDVQMLEDRILYSATPLPVDTAGLDGYEGDVEGLEEALQAALLDPAQAETEAGSPAEAVFIDSSLDDLELLLQQYLENDEVDVFVIDSDEDGIAFISETLAASGREYASLHIVTHGSAGAIELGDIQLTHDNLSDYQTQLSSWAQYLSEDADILFYGCDVAQTEDGRQLLSVISAWTGADIAASDDLTGHEALGGDWILEYEVGDVEAEVAFEFSVRASWRYSLDITSNLVLHNTFDTDASDSSGNNNNGTLTNGAVIDTNGATNQIGNGKLSLDGSNDYVDFSAHASDFQGITEGTISVWVYHDVNSRDVIFETSDSGDSDSRVALFRDDDGSFDFYIREGSTTLLDVSTAAGIIPLSTWTHVAVTVDASGNKLYVNGVQQTVTYATGSASTNRFFDDVTQLDFGSWGVDKYGGSNHTRHFDGFLDDGRVYDRALSGSDVAELYTYTGLTTVTTTFQQGVNGYTGTQDTTLEEDDGTANGSATTINVDLDSSSKIQQGLIRFEDILEGTGIPKGVQITSASLTVYVTNESSGTISLYGMQSSWDESSLWSHFDGLTVGGELALTPDAQLASGGTGSKTFTGLEDAVQRWVDGYSNYGWGILTNSTDGWDIYSSEGATAPILSVTYIAPGSQASAAHTLTVDTANDVSDGDTTSIDALLANKGADGKISFREAIWAANNTTNFDASTPDVINFAIGTEGTSHAIVLAEALPGLTDSVYIDALSQGGTGYTGNPLIEIDGSSTANFATSLITIWTGDSTVRGFALTGSDDEAIEIDGSTSHGTTDNNVIEYNWVGIDLAGNVGANADNGILVVFNSTDTIIRNNVVAGNSGIGIDIRGAGVDGTIVEGNKIGVLADGATIVANGSHGIRIGTSAINTRIGTDGSDVGAQRNIISGNSGSGISVEDVSSVTIDGNYIGTDITGALDRGNVANGITVGASATSIVIGTAGYGNVISGNTGNGIYSDASSLLVSGNTIGLNSAGSSKIGNSGDGIVVNSGTGTVIGGSVAGTGNVISGNSDAGIRINSGASGTTIQGNLIGTGVTGLTALGNTNEGILIVDSASNTIGGTTPEKRNLISGNGLGIRIGGAGSTSNVIVGNYIGTDINGNATLGNTFDGIFISRFAGAATGDPTNNQIGGTNPGEGNLIAGNLRDGIRIYASAGIVGNAILGNTIHSNAGLGIDLGGDGVTANDGMFDDTPDQDSGANGKQNFPVLSSVTAGPSPTIIGSLKSTPSRTFRVEFFASTTGDSSGYGEGQRYLGFVNVTTNATGDATIATTLAAFVATGERVSATATDLTTNSTSEFALNVTATNAAPVLDSSKNPALSSQTEGDGPPSGAVGTLVSSLVDFATPTGQVDNVTDSNFSPGLGIAVTGANTSNGTLWYSTDAGVSWNVLGTVSDASARLLAADSSTRIYFEPHENFSGTISDAITFRAWDQTSGSSGALADTTSNGGSTAFSTATDTASLTVNAMPDAPVAVDDISGLDFDGTDDYVSAGTDASLEMTNTMTMEAWINPDATANSWRMIMNREGEYEVALDGSGKLLWAFANTDPGWAWHDTGYTVANDTWSHIAVTYDNGTVSTYVNGGLVEVYNGSGAIGDSHATKDEFRIGSRENSPAGQYFDGQIDEVRVWNTARSQAEILANLDTSLVGNETGLAGYWKFNEGSGTSASDSAGTNHGTLIDGGAGTVGPQWTGYVTDQDTPLSVNAASGVMANDIDVDGDTLTVTQVNGSGANVNSPFALPSGALLTLTASGSFTYDPNGAFDYLAAGQTATDSFTYQVGDGTGNFSTATAYITVSGDNDAPTLDTNAFLTMTTITEDQTANVGDTIAAILASDLGVPNPITDVDSGAVEGIAIYSLTSGNGTWEYNTGSGWTAVGSVSVAESLLLRASDSLRFVPGSQTGSTEVVAFAAWDQTTGTAGTKVDSSVFGGTTAFSDSTDTAVLTVNSINDAGSISNGFESYSGLFGGSGTRFDAGKANYNADELLAIDVNQTYDLSATAFAGNIDPGEYHYLGFTSYDSDGLAILAQHVGKWAGSTDTTLAVDLVAGATEIVLTDASGWHNAGLTYASSLAWYGYTNSDGGTYDDYTYTRNVLLDLWDAGAISGNTITLREAWAGPTISAGEAVRNATSPGGTYQYPLLSSGAVPGTPTTYNVTVGGGEIVGGGYSETLFRPGTAYISPLVLANYTNTTTELTVSDFTIAASTGTTVFTEDGPAVAIVDSDVQITDVDDLYTESITIQLTNGKVGDILHVNETAINALGISVAGIPSGALTADGVITLTLTSDSANSVTHDDYEAALAAITFENVSQDPDTTNRILTLVQNDGDSDSPTNSLIIKVHAVDDAPVTSITGDSPTWTENGGPVGVFSNASIDLVESGDLVGSLVLSVSGIADGNSEIMVIDGEAIQLTDLQTGTTSANGYSYSVSVAGSSATVTVSKAAGFSGAAAETLLNSVAYNNTSEAPTGPVRVITFTSITESEVDGVNDTSINGTASLVTINSVNDAPVLDNAGATALPTITKLQVNNGGASVASIIASSGGDRITDVDNGAVEGIAITTLASGNGTWEYSINGGASWNAIGAVSDASALLLGENDMVRFVPNGASGTTASFDFHAWDQTTGSAGTKVDASVRGGSTAFSTDVERADITVSDTNAAPLLDSTKSPSLSPIAEDAGAPVGAVGSQISEFVDFATPSGQLDNVTDVDSGAGLGIAITAADTTNGTWFYSINNGVSWNALGAVSDTNARLLADDGSTRLYFQANADYHGTLANAITFHAWDQTSGSNGGIASLVSGPHTVLDNFNSGYYTNNNGTHSWASGWVETDNDGNGASNGDIDVKNGQLNVKAKVVNDEIYREADLTSASAATLTFSYNNPITGSESVVIQVSGDGGGSYTTLYTFDSSTNTGSSSKSIDISSYIASDTRIRILVDASSGSPEKVTFDDVQIEYNGIGGGDSAFSTDADTASLTVTAVADTPAVTDTTTDEDTQSTSGLVISRNVVDGAEVTHFKITGITDGILYKSDGVTQIADGSFITFAEGNAGLKFTPDADFNGTGHFSIQGSTASNDAGLGGSVVEATITVNPINDAPEGADNTITMLEDDEYTFTATDFGFSDIDGDAFHRVYIESLPTNGQLLYNGSAFTAGNFVSKWDIDLGRLTFKPASGGNGTAYDSFTFTVTDDGGTANGGVDRDQSANAITIDVTSAYRIEGNIFEDVNGDSNLVDAVGASGATVYLYQDTDDDNGISAGDTLYATTTTDVNGFYSFSSLLDDTYFVVVDSRTIAPSAGLNATFTQADVWAEQTYGVAGAASGASFQLASGSLFGGRAADVSDDASSLLTAEHVTRVSISGSDAANVDSGFSFNVVTGVRDGDDVGGENRSIQGSLRQFVDNANALAGDNVMRFVPGVTVNSSGASGDWWTVTLQSNLASLTDAGTTIDGTAYDSADGTSVRNLNTGDVNSARTVGVDAMTFDATERQELEIFANGNTQGIVIDAANATVQDVAIYGSVRTTGNTGAQVYITENVVAAGGASVVNTVLGARADGSDPGVNRGSSGMAIDGASTVTNNYIAYLDISGVRFNGLFYGNTDGSSFTNNEVHTVAGSHTAGDAITVDSQGNTVQGNYIHDVVLATVVYPYNGKGIELWYDSNNNLIDNNTIVAAVTAGIGLGDNANNNTISKNVVTGTTGFGGEGGAGILLTYYTGATEPTANTISENAIYGNFGIGIDLDSRTGASAFGDGQNANDGALLTTEVNEGIDHPVVTLANLVGTSLTLTGYVGDAPNDTDFANAKVEFFVSDGSGEGQTYLGFLTTDANGNFSGSLTVSGVADTDMITATATLSSVGTSEFGNEFGVNVAPVISVPASQTANEDESHSINGVSVGDADTNVSSVQLSVSNGSLSVSLQGAATISAGTNGSAALTLSGTQADINSTLATLSYLGNTNYNGSDSLSIVASDAGGLTDSENVAITVNAVNDAPVYDPSGDTILQPITEDDILNSGETVANIIASAGGNRITDVDAGAQEGFAIRATTEPNGKWQYLLDGDTVWQDVGTVSNASALLLRDIDKLRFLPNGENGGAPTLSVRAWDQTSGTAGDKVDTGSGGGTSAFGSAPEEISIAVSSVNDAPTVVDTTVVNLAGTNEDSTSAATSIDSIVSSAGWNDVDAGALKGVAITGLTGNGTWEFTTNGTDWVSFGGVSGTNALLLNATAQVRYVPDGTNGETATFSFIAWDTTADTASTSAVPSYADPGITGGTSAYSSESATASIVVTSINDAVVVTPDSNTAVEAGGTGNGTAGVNPTGNVLANDYDVDAGDTIDVSGVAAGVQISASGSVAVSVAGLYGSINIASDGSYTYVVDNDNAAVQDLLSSSDTLQDIFTYTVQDSSGAESTTQITLTIQGANDAPESATDFDDAYEAGGTSNGTPGTDPSGNVLSNDDQVDAGDTWAITGVASGAVASASGSVGTLVAGSFGSITINSDGSYTYNVDNANATVQALRQTTDTLTDVFTYTVDDGLGLDSTAQITITLHGANDNPEGVVDNATAIEAGGLANGTAGTNPTGNVLANDTDVDSGDTQAVAGVAAGVQVSTSGNVSSVVSGSYGSIIIASNGSYTYTVDNGNAAVQALATTSDTLDDVFSYTVVDAAGATSTTQITVTIQGANDAPVATVEVGDSVTSSISETNTTLTSSGTITVTDVDLTDPVSAAVTGVVASGTTTGLQSNGAALLAMLASTTNVLDGTEITDQLTWNFNSGSEAFDYLAVGESLTLTYTITVTDSQGSTDTQDVVITVNGTQDAPVVTVEVGDSTADTLTETDSALTTSGTLTVSDLDLSDLVTSAPSSVVASGTSTGLQSDNAALLAMLTSTTNVLDGTELTDTLTWNFNSGSEAFDYLAVGESLTLTYTVTVTDSQAGTATQDIVITINGTQDAPIVSVEVGDSAAETLNETDATLTSSGTLTVTDLDLSDVTGSVVSSVVAGGSTTGLQSNNAALLAMLSSTANVLDATEVSDTLTWNFNSGSEAFDYLAVGESLTLTYTITVTDSQGATGTQDVVITIDGTGDAPIVSVEVGDSAAETLTETNGALTSSGTLTVSDSDLTDVVTSAVSSVTTGGTTAGLQSDNAALLAMLTSTANVIDGTELTNTLTWDFNSGSEAFDYLAVGESLTLTYTITVTDSQGASDTQDVVITISGTQDAVDISIGTGDSAAAALSETNATLTSSGTLTVTDLDLSDVVTSAVSNVVAGGDTTGLQPDNAALLAMFSSTATVLDGTELTDTLTWNFNSGSETFDYLDVGQSLTLTYTITVTDSQGATDTQDVVITINGSNDAPVVTIEVGDSAADTLTETDSTLSTSGTLTVTDTDLADVVGTSVSSVVAGGTTSGLQSDNAALLAMLTSTANVIDGTETTDTLTWDFNSGSEAFDYLAVGESLTLTYTITATDSHGATGTRDVVITVSGSNDVPVITVEVGDSAAETLTETDATLTSSGTLSVEDYDLSDIVSSTVSGVTASGTTTGLGSNNATLRAMMTSTGTVLDGTELTDRMTWNFNSGSEAFDYLAVGESLTLTYTITVTDTQGATDTQDVVLTIHGTNDSMVANTDTATAVEAGGYANASAGTDPTGNVLANDTDADASNTLSVDGVAAGVVGSATGSVGSPVSGSYGAIVINSDGSYSYVVNNTHASVQALRTSGDTLDDVFTYTAVDTDGATSTTQITVTIQGNNDAPGAVDDTAVAVEAGGIANGTAGTNPTGNVLSNDTDVDIGDSRTVDGVAAGSQASASGSVGSGVNGSYGSVTISSDGSYSYTVDNSNAAVQALRTSADTLTDVFTYTMVDTAGLTSTAELTVTIQGSNDDPIAVADTPTAIEAGGVSNGSAGSNSTGNVLSNDTDVDDGDTKTVNGVAAGTQTSASGNVGAAVVGNYGAITVDSDGTYHYAVDNLNSAVQALRTTSDTLQDIFTYTFVDAAGGESTTQVTITIQGQNDNPEAVADHGIAVEAGGSSNGTAGSDASGNVLTNDTDVDSSDTKAVGGVRAGIHSSATGNVGSSVAGSFGAITVNSDGSYSYVVDNSNSAVEALGSASDTLQDVFTYTTVDASGASGSSQLTITIQGQNDAPVAFGDNYTTTYIDEVVVGAPGVKLNDMDVEGDVLSATLISGPASGTLTFNADGSFSYKPVVGFVGEVYIQYVSDDGAAQSNISTITINVAEPNLPPPPDNSGDDGDSGDDSDSSGEENAETEVESSETDSGDSTATAGSQKVSNLPFDDGSDEGTSEEGKSLANRVLASKSGKSAKSISVGAFGAGDSDQFFGQVGPQALRMQELSSLRLSNELNSLQIGELNDIHLVYAEVRQQLEDDLSHDFFESLDPLVTAAVGTGVVIWLINAGQVAAALLSTASTFVQLDPLTVLQNMETSDVAETSEERMFDATHIDR